MSVWVVVGVMAPKKAPHTARTSQPVRGLRLHYDYATALSHCHWAKAGRLMVGAMLSDSWLRWTAPALGTLMGMIFRPDHDQFASDVMVEADAEMALDSGPVLHRIREPVLLIGGDKEFYIPVALYHETARLIPDCTLMATRGKAMSGPSEAADSPPTSSTSSRESLPSPPGTKLRSSHPRRKKA